VNHDPLLPLTVPVNRILLAMIEPAHGYAIVARRMAERGRMPPADSEHLRTSLQAVGARPRRGHVLGGSPREAGECGACPPK
jgi:hypothetical protein